MPRAYVIVLLALGLAVLLSLAIGSVFVPPVEVWRALTGGAASETFRTIVMDIRLPRTVLMVLVGAALVPYADRHIINAVLGGILLLATVRLTVGPSR